MITYHTYVRKLTALHRLDLLARPCSWRNHCGGILQDACQSPFEGYDSTTEWYPQKWLQYETVLGPEADSDTPEAQQGNPEQGTNTTTGGQPDPEKGGGRPEKGGGRRTMAVSGPGMADLHTEGNKEEV